jgi:hypothetical protein
MFAITTVLLLTGCSENGFSALDKDKIIPEPDIHVDPTFIEFSELRTDAEEVKSFTVSNPGDAQLQVTDMTIEGDAFTLLSPDLEFFLDPGESKDIAVAFTPTQAYDNLGLVIVFSDDKDEPEVEVILEGLGAVPELLISPDPLDFGDLQLYCTDEQGVTLSNIGQETLVIDDVTFKTSAGQFELLDSTEKPISLETGESTGVGVRFVPTTQGPHTSSIAVVSNDPRGTVSSAQNGEGIYESDGSDTFVVPLETADQFVVPDRITDAHTAPFKVSDQHTVPEDPPVDILFAVDQSCSMDSINTPLAAAFNDFIVEINNVTTGWNIGVVTNDDGCFNSGVLTDTTSGYESLFNNAVTTGGCSGGSPDCDTEALLKLTNTALSQTSSCNAGFLRSGAMLHVIVVSDEEERSNVNYATWLNNFQAYVADPSLLKVSAIADIYTACGDQSGPGGYLEAANATGGEVLDVCTSDWSQKTQDLALASLTAVNQYALTQVASTSTLEVYVDGVLTSTGWYYDSSTNSVVFTSTFNGGEVIDVDYYPYGASSNYSLSSTPNQSSIEVYVDGVQWTTGWTYDSVTNSVVFTTDVNGGSLVEIDFVDAASVASFVLSSTPNTSSIEVSVDGYPWTNYWSYDSASNSVGFSVDLTPGAVVDVIYIDSTAIGSFVLTATPDPVSIIVTVDGVQWTSGWAYDSASNELEFSQALDPGATVVADYGVLGACP